MQIELAKRLLGQRGENSTGRVVVDSSGGGASGVAGQHYQHCKFSKLGKSACPRALEDQKQTVDDQKMIPEHFH